MRRSKRTGPFLRGLLSGGFVFSSAAFAQQTALPNGGLPTREEVTQPTAGQSTQQPSRLRIEGDIERAGCPLADPAYKDIRVTISGASFNHLAPVTAEELAPSYQAYLGKDQPVSVICDIRDAAATLLRKKGYLAAVQVPTQKIEGGVVKFEVLYARMTAVRVRGEAGRAEHLIAGYLEKLTRDPVFNRYTAERYLLLARDLPGYDIRLVLRPAGAAPGEFIGDVIVAHTPVEADLNVQNFAARSTGRFGGQLRAQFYGLTGLGDRTTVSYYSTADFKEQKILQLGHDFRVGPEGLTFSGRFTHAWTKPDIGLATGNIKAGTTFATIEASYPLLRSQRANMRASAGLDYVDQTVRFAGTPISRDRLRVAYLRLDGDMTDVNASARSRWRAGYSLEVRRGFDILDASGAPAVGVIGPSRSDGDAEGTLVRASGFAEAALTPAITVSIAPRLQYAFDALLSFEEYSGGSYTVGRGYDPGTIIGDSGAGFTAEARINRFSPLKATDLVLQPFVFVDAAWVWNKHVPGDPQQLTSVGGGVRSSFANRFRLDLTLAVPTKRAGFQADRGDVRFLVSFTTKLYPWSNP